MEKPEQKITEVDALLAIAEAIARLAAATEIIASPPPEMEERAHEQADRHTD